MPVAKEGSQARLRPPAGSVVCALASVSSSMLERRRSIVPTATALAPTLRRTLFSSWPSSSWSAATALLATAAETAAWRAAGPTAAWATPAGRAFERWKPGQAIDYHDSCPRRPALVGGRGVFSRQVGKGTRLFSQARETWADARLRRQSLLATLSPDLRLFRSLDTASAAQSKLPPAIQSNDEKGEKETMASRAARHEKEAKEAKALAAAAFAPADAAVVSKKDLWTRLREGAKHYWDGTRLLAYEVKISTKLLYRLTKGDKLTRREHRQLKRSIADMLRLVPFLVFVIVPFLEFLLPVFLKLFPNMLPSTFEDKDLAEAKKKKLLKVRLDVAEFLQDTIGEIGIQGNTSNAKAGKEFAEFFRKIRTTGELASAEEISKMAKRFEDDITLENLSRPQLVSMCRYMNINAFGTDNFLRFQVRNKMQKLKVDDKMIQAEGVDSLTVPELQQACSSRGIRTLGVSPARLREELQQWLDLHLNHQIPSILLILSRAFILTEKPTTSVSSQEALQATLSSLPDQLVNVTELQVSEVEGTATPKQKFSVIEQQEELIADEREQEEKEELARKIAMENEEREELRSEREEQAMKMAEENEEREKKELSAKAAMDQLLRSEEITEDVKLSDEQLKDIREALAVLSSKSTVDSERLRLAEIIEDREEYKEDIEELKTAERSESKASTRLGARLEKLIQKLDVELRQYDTEIGSRVDLSQAGENGQVSVEELEKALRLVRHNPQNSRIRTIVQKLDKDGDGLVFLKDLQEIAQEAEGHGVVLETKEQQ